VGVGGYEDITHAIKKICNSTPEMSFLFSYLQVQIKSRDTI